MKRSIVIFITILGLYSACPAQSSKPANPDIQQFELTPAAIPEPALKYQIMFDDMGDRRPGNAALLYHTTILLLGPNTKDKTEKALDAYDAHDLKTFDALADSLQLPNVFQELDLAGRREECNWEPPFHEMGAYTLLPHLEPLAHATARLIKIRALREMEQGKAVDAIHTLRLGYELSNNVGKEQVLISGLVSVAITSQMNDAMIQLLSRPETPNLYWALREFPSRHRILEQAMHGERQWWLTTGPSLPGAMKGTNLAERILAGEQLSAEQWREILAYIGKLVIENNDLHKKLPDPVKDATPAAQVAAAQRFAAVHHQPADQVALVDPIVVLGEYYFAQYQIQFDNMYKLRSVPYPEMFREGRKAHDAAVKARDEQFANPFLQSIMSTSDAGWRFARADRQLAALATVEALRAYAAANDGKLPAHLEDMTDEPAPQNPATENPFEYRLENDVATLSDTQSQTPLTYTIKIRR